MDSLVHKLHTALGAQGCAVCRLRRQVEEHYLEGFLYESVNDRALRDQMADSLGFCHAHAWQLQQVEMRLWGGGLGVGIVYDDLSRQAVGALSAYVAGVRLETRAAKAALPVGVRNMLARLGWPRAIRRLMPSLARLHPRKPCPACIYTDQFTREYLSALVRGCADEAFRASLCAADAICLPHLRAALAMAAHLPQTRLFLAETELRKLQALSQNLAEYVRKQNWHYRAEATQPEEFASRHKALAFFAGESTTDER